MAELFLSVVMIGLAASPLLLLALLCEPFFAKRYSPKLFYFVWLVLAVRLLIPWNPTVQSISPAFAIAVPQSVYQEVPPLSESLPPPYTIGDERPSEVAVGESPAAPPLEAQLLHALPFLWGAGAVLFLLFHLLAYHTTYRRFLHSATDVSDEVRVLFGECKSEVGISGSPTLYQCRLVQSPLLIGFFRPMVLLPQTDLPTEQLRMILRHELLHDKRKDLWYKLLMLAVNALHWWNPLVYWMQRRAAMSVEMSCDADVLGTRGTVERVAYAETILLTMKKASQYQTPLKSSFYGGNKQMINRFGAIVNKPQRKGVAGFCAVLVAIVCSGSLLTCVPVAADVAKPQKPAPLSTSTMPAALPRQASGQDLLYPQPSAEQLNA